MLSRDDEKRSTMRVESDDFKNSAVQLVTEQKYPIAAVARSWCESAEAAAVARLSRLLIW
jgi:transposase-like protein